MLSFGGLHIARRVNGMMFPHYVEDEHALPTPLHRLRIKRSIFLQQFLTNPHVVGGWVNL